MRFPLILAAKPIVGHRFPTVTLSAGDWFISSDHVDSQIIFNYMLDGSLKSIEISPKCQVYLPDETKVWATISSAGTERYLSVFAERIV